MENEKKEQLLPIGTIVLLKNANTELMITSYCMAAMPQNYEELLEDIRNTIPKEISSMVELSFYK